MVGVTVKREIRAPRERVFEAFTDLRRAPERVNGIERLEVLGDGPVGPGTRFRETRRMFGREATEEMRIGEFEPPTRYTAEAESHGTRYYTEFLFHEKGPEMTEVEMRFEATPVSFVAKLMAPLGKKMMKHVENECSKDMDDLKSWLESAPAEG